jgi:hypothetical protein
MAERRPMALLELMRWLLIKTRPPGMIGRAAAFIGRGASGASRLERRVTGWDLIEGTPTVSRHGDDDVVRLVADGRFVPRQVEIIPDLAGLLYKQAVHDVEVSITHLGKATAAVDKMRETGETMMPFVFASTALDRAVRASAAAAILPIAAGQVQVNAWVTDSGGN